MATASYEAARMLIQQMLEQIKTLGGDPEKFIDKATQTAYMIVKDWMRDADGKPNKRPEDTRYGVYIKRRDVNYRYISELATLLKETKSLKLEPESKQEEAEWRLRALIWKRLDMTEGAYVDYHVGNIEQGRKSYKDQTWKYITHTLRDEGFDEETIGELIKVFVDRGYYGDYGVTDERSTEEVKPHYPRSTSNWSKNFGYIRNARRDLELAKIDLEVLKDLERKAVDSGEPQMYGDVLLTLNDLQEDIIKKEEDVLGKQQVVSNTELKLSRFNSELVSYRGGRYSKYHTYGVDIGAQGHGNKQGFLDDVKAVADITGLQSVKIFGQLATTFGDYSRISEYRQSADVYEHTFDRLHGLIKGDKVLSKELEGLGVTPEGKDESYTVEQLLKVLHDENNKAVASQIRSKVTVWLAMNKKSADDASMTLTMVMRILKDRGFSVIMTYLQNFL